MKRQFLIAVDIDTETEGRSEATLGDDIFHVRLRRDAHRFGLPLHIAAHELGHVLAHVFAMPATQLVTALHAVGESVDVYGAENVAMEREAWDIAAQMVTPNAAFVRSRKAALATYGDTQESD